MSWAGWDRRSRLPDNWEQLRAECRRRAKGRCQATAHDPACNGTGTDADHINQGDDHHIDNLQWLSRPCHDRKTRLDNGLARAASLPAETHPGRR